MKNSAIIRILIWSFIALVWLGLLVGGLTGKLDFFNFTGKGLKLGLNGFTYDNAERYKMCSELSAAELDRIASSEDLKLDIHWISGNVDIKAGREFGFGETFESKSPEEDEYMRWYFDEGADTLYLQFRKAGMYMTNPEGKHLTVTVPNDKVDLFSKIKIESVSADLNIENLITTSTDIENVSGTITVKEGDYGSFDIETVSGGAIIGAGFDELYFDSVSGGIDALCTGCPSIFNAETVSGHMALTIGENRSFNTNFESVSGDFNCTLPTVSMGEDSFSYTAPDSDGFIGSFSFNSVSGDIMVKGSF